MRPRGYLSSSSSRKPSPRPARAVGGKEQVSWGAGGPQGPAPWEGWPHVGRAVCETQVHQGAKTWLRASPSLREVRALPAFVLWGRLVRTWGLRFSQGRQVEMLGCVLSAASAPTLSCSSHQGCWKGLHCVCAQGRWCLTVEPGPRAGPQGTGGLRGCSPVTDGSLPSCRARHKRSQAEATP